MASKNNDDDPRNKKQKKTEVVEHVDQDSSNDSVSLPLSLSTPAVVVIVPSTLSFGTVLEEFPDFFSCVLLYIADRVIWNSIAASNKDIHKKSKAILPPWPECYKLPIDGDCWAWSPCGTRIACSVRFTYITIFDERLGPLHNHRNAHHGGHPITDLKYSPDGRYLVSTGNDSFVRLWDTVTGNYEQLQEWNMREEIAGEVSTYLSPNFSISTCSKYIVVAIGTCAFLKDVENGITIKSLMPPFAPRIHIDNIKFSADDRAVFICRNGIIQIWYPYLHDDDDSRLITLTRKLDSGVQLSEFRLFTFSDDNSMVVIQNNWTKKGALWSIDKDHKCLTQKFDFQGSTGFHFTPDGKSIVVSKENGRPILWSIVEGVYTNNTVHFLDNGSNYTNHNNLVVTSLSPNNRQCIVQRSGTGSRYITFFV